MPPRPNKDRQLKSARSKLRAGERSTKAPASKNIDVSRSWQDVAVQTVFGKPGYQESGAGGLILKGLTALAKSKAASPVRAGAREIGEFVAEHSGQAKNYLGRGPRIEKVSGNVFTPQGVFKGKDVFVSKPAVSPDKAASVQKALDTRARRELARQTRIGAKGAAYGAVGGAAGLYGAQRGVATVKQNIKSAKKVGGAIRSVKTPPKKK